MREIKFRAITENGIFYVPSEGFSLSINDTGCELVMWCGDGIIDSLPVLSIDQYTGLKDKNGKEIYEGDILQNLTPARDFDDHYGDNIPGPMGHYRQKLEPIIDKSLLLVKFDSMADEENPLLWLTTEYNRDYMIECFQSNPDEWEDDLEYLLSELKIESEDDLIKHLGVSVAGNIHENPDLLAVE